ncbi:MAG: hypothetical protein ACTHM8_09150 [Sphingomonas sp.]
MRFGMVAIIVLALLGTTPALATRKLPVGDAQGWQHAQTGLILMSDIAGLHRTELQDFGDSELDIIAQFDDPSRDTEATLYLFRPALDSVPVWFDRAVTTLSNHDIYGGVTAVGAPQAFARPGGSVADSLRQTFVPAKSDFKATALAVIPVGEWLVSIRISGKTLAPAALDDLLNRFIAGLRFATPVAARPAAVPVVACATHPAFKHAKLQKPDMMDTILGATFATITDDDVKKVGGTVSPPPVWCRDSVHGNDYAVYRQDDGTAGYTMALGDAGRTISVWPSLEAQINKKTGFSVSFHDLDKTLIYPSYDALAEPAQVFDMIKHEKPTSAAAGKTITISTDK